MALVCADSTLLQSCCIFAPVVAPVSQCTKNCSQKGLSLIKGLPLKEGLSLVKVATTVFFPLSQVRRFPSSFIFSSVERGIAVAQAACSSLVFALHTGMAHIHTCAIDSNHVGSLRGG